MADVEDSTRTLIRRLSRQILPKLFGGVTVEMAAQIGDAIVDALEAECPKDRLYICAPKAIEARDKGIREKCRELSQRHSRAKALEMLRLRTGLSARQLRRICKEPLE